MTLNFFLSQVTLADHDRQMIFATIDGEIGAGYHVTELKLEDVRSIDCGGQRASWTQASLQLLDGYGEDHMTVEKFKSIVVQSVEALPDLGDAPLRIEFSPGNDGLSLFQIGAVQRTETKLIVGLQPLAAVCKPVAKVPEQAAVSRCCSARKLRFAC